MENEVVSFCQKAIAESGLVLDEDLIFLHMVEHNIRKPKVDDSRGYIILATSICTTYYAWKTRNVKVLSEAAMFSLPTTLSLLMSFYHTRTSISKQKAMLQLLTEFRHLSHIHSEVNDFFKRFHSLMDPSNNSYMKITEETIQDLSKYSCDMQTCITKMMLNVISEIHVGLHDISLDLTDFEKATAIPLNHDTVTNCLCNANFIEGQVVLLRSHLLTSIFLVSSSKGDPVIFRKVLDNSIPALVQLMKDAIEKIKFKLNKIRFPPNLPFLSIKKIENIFEQKKMVSVPRMRKHVIKINDGICCTLIKLRALLETVEMVENDMQMIYLQEAVATLTQELYGCYVSSLDLEKLIQLLNRNMKNVQCNAKTLPEMSEEDCIRTPTNEKILSETDEPTENLDYQVFANDLDEIVNDNEGHAVHLYKRLMNDSDWLAELKQSEEFQRRQNKFHTGSSIRSAPVDQTEKKNFETVPSLAAPAPLKKFKNAPPPPPLPSWFSADSSEIKVPIIPTTSPATQEKSKSDSSLLYSLKDVLDKIGPREEDEYE